MQRPEPQLHLRSHRSYFKSKKAVAHFHSKRVIERDIFTHRADYRDGAADAENLIDSGGLKGSLSGYDSL